MSTLGKRVREKRDAIETFKMQFYYPTQFITMQHRARVSRARAPCKLLQVKGMLHWQVGA